MKVRIDDHNGNLRLRWNDGKLRTMAIAVKTSPVGLKYAETIKAQIELDFQIGQYDRTLLRYRPQTIGKNATEISAPELFERFTEYQKKQKGLSQSSIDSRYTPLNRALKKQLNRPANTIGKKQAEQFADYCEETLNPATAKARISLLQSCWNWAKSRYQVAEDNPWLGISLRFRPQPVQKIQPFTADEARAIMEGFRSSVYYAHYADFVMFLFGVGCRFGEAVGLRWEHISSDCKSIWIGQSISKGRVGSTKTKIARTVNLLPSVGAILESRKESQQPKPSALVFTTPNGLPIDDRNFRRRAWKQVLKAVEIPYRKPYSTRHTAVSHALANGANYLAVAEATGHNPQTMHKHYASAIEKKPIFVDFYV